MIMCNCRFSRDSDDPVTEIFPSSVVKGTFFAFFKYSIADLLRALFKIKIYHSWLFKITYCATTVCYLSAVQGTNRLINVVKIFSFFQCVGIDYFQVSKKYIRLCSSWKTIYPVL